MKIKNLNIFDNEGDMKNLMISLSQDENNLLDKSKEYNFPYGLKPDWIKIKSNYVVLVGKNGAGKSRILKYIKEKMMYSFTLLQDELIQNPKNFLLNGKLHFNPLSILFDCIPYDLEQEGIDIVEKYIETPDPRLEYNAKVKDWEDLEEKEKKWRNRLSSYICYINSRSISDLRIGKNSFKKNSSANFSNIIHNDEDYDENNGDLLNKNAYDFFMDLPNKPESHLIPRCIDYFNEFLGYKLAIGQEYTEVRKNRKPVWVLNDNKFDYRALSDGQRLLFSYILLFIFHENVTKTKLSESIILIDEPEMHLHFSVLEILLDKLKKVVQDKGQLWIATHDISCISNFDYRSIYLVKDGSIITPNKKILDSSFEEIVGSSLKLDRISKFLSSSHDWAFENFMLQCLNEPDVILSSPKDDPQYSLIHNFLKNNTGFYILDFGAGKGRLGTLLFDHFDDLNLDALEPNTALESYLEKSGYKNVYSQNTELPKLKYDLILMSNVLHEIDPRFWVDIFLEISASLKEAGKIFIIEDLQLPYGEKAHEFNYLILSNPHLSLLFDSGEIIKIVSEDEKYLGRIEGNIVPKNILKRISQVTINSALNSLRENSLLKLVESRGHGLTEGRTSAFYSMQYVNATLALKELSTFT